MASPVTPNVPSRSSRRWVTKRPVLMPVWNASGSGSRHPCSLWVLGGLFRSRAEIFGDHAADVACGNAALLLQTESPVQRGDRLMETPPRTTLTVITPIQAGRVDDLTVLLEKIDREE